MGERRQMSDNEPVEARAALLIAAAPDPATQDNVIFHVVKELSEADYDRYRSCLLCHVAGRSAADVVQWADALRLCRLGQIPD
jgi:hypothetical protein